MTKIAGDGSGSISQRHRSVIRIRTKMSRIRYTALSHTFFPAFLKNMMPLYSVPDPWHFGLDPDLQIRTSDYRSRSESSSFRQWPSRWQQKITYGTGSGSRTLPLYMLFVCKFSWVYVSGSGLRSRIQANRKGSKTRKKLRNFGLRSFLKGWRLLQDISRSF